MKPRGYRLRIKPESWSLEKLLDAQLGQTALLATSSITSKVTETLPFNPIHNLDDLPNDLETLIVIGGGTLIDEAKVWRVRNSPKSTLVAIPSLWGSGAEISPVAVLNRKGKKEIHIADELIPDIRCLWPELAASIPENLARHGCGDAWSHALEGFLSPLANHDVQSDLANVIQDMIVVPLGNDSRWFELSARACFGQSQASVGLVHGIAHTLEHPSKY